MVKLDLLDRKVMYELDLNARLTSSQLAKKLRRSKETVNFRVNRLVKNGYVKGFYTVLNTSKLGWYYYKVYMKFKNTTPDKEKEIFGYLQKQDHTAYLGSMEGYYDCIFLVMVQSPKDMTDFMNPFIENYGEFIQEKEIHTVVVAHRLNQKFLFSGEASKDSCYSEVIGNYKLDDVDKKILQLISQNARMPLIEIAKRVNVDHKVVKYRLKKLERDNIILSYVSSPDFDKLGLIFIQINISLKNPGVKKSLINYFDSTKKCLFALELLGKYDFTVEIHVENNEQLRSIIDEFRVKFANQYNGYDVSTIRKEYVMVWLPPCLV